MKTTDLDRIVTSKAVDKVAGRQMSGGIHWTPEINYANHLHMDAPLLARRDLSDGADLVGRRFGRFTVVGLFHDQGSKTSRDKGRRWQVRCDCGQYEVRRTKALKRLADPDECCKQCSYLRRIKRQEHFRLYGKWPDKP